MSAPRHSIWLRCYPRAWRERYGEELDELLLATSGGGAIPLRTCLDLLRGGAHERLRAWGLIGEGIPPAEQVRGGALLVLWAWALFIVAGSAIQKFSEHWQAATPASSRGLPSGAFQTLTMVAILAGGLVLSGIVLTLPRVAGLLRAEWGEIRRPALRALLLSAIVVGATALLAGWSHHLNSAQRNGHDTAYGFGFSAWALLAFASLAAWTALAVTVARRIDLSERVLKLEAGLALAVSFAMLTMTVATALWWGSLAYSSPWVLHGERIGAQASPLAFQPGFAAATMALATLLAALGTTRALRAVPRLADS